MDLTNYCSIYIYLSLTYIISFVSQILLYSNCLYKIKCIQVDRLQYPYHQFINCPNNTQIPHQIAKLVMQKSGRCNCGQPITIPRPECLVECTACKTKALFLCHYIGNVENPMHIQCRQCHNEYSLLTCPQCEATAIIKDFSPGQIYMCVCGFKATMLACNRCVALLCLPARKNYEQSLIKCKKCDNQFKFSLCPSCKACAYLKPHQKAKDIPFCFNDQCERSAERQQLNHSETLLKQSPLNKMPPVGSYPSVTPQKDEKQLCRVCMNKQSCMINTKCFHLSVCEVCSYNLNGRCPICRGQGTYKKVFKS